MDRSTRATPRAGAAARPWLVLCLAAASLLVAPRPAAASGSEALLVAGEWCSVELRETFRKIHVSRDSARQYREQAEARFFAALAPAWGSIDRLLAGSEGGALRRYDASLPLAVCDGGAGGCAAALKGAYPRLVALPPFEVGESAAVTVTVALTRRPPADRLAALAKTLRSLLRRHLRRSPEATPPAPAAVAAALEVPGAGYFVRLRSGLRPASAERVAPLEEQLRALAEGLRAWVDGVLSRSPAVGLAGDCPPSGPPTFYGDTRTLPGRVAVSHDDPRAWVQVQLCLERLEAGDATLGELQEGLGRALASGTSVAGQE